VSTTDELLRNAEEYAAGFDKGDLPLPPARKIAVLARGRERAPARGELSHQAQ
jgi:hypothetical protein